MGKLNTIWKTIRKYKYFFVFGIFILVVGFLDENSFWNRYQHQQEIRELRDDIRRYTEQYERDTRELNNLETDPEAIRKIARERYYMKKDCEDVYVFVDEPDLEKED